MFSLAQPDRVRDLLLEGGFIEVEVEAIDFESARAGVEAYLDETTDLSVPFAQVREGLDQREWEAVVERVGQLAEPFVAGEGTLRMPARSLVASASA